MATQLTLKVDPVPIRILAPERHVKHVRPGLLRLLERLRQGPASTEELIPLCGRRVAARVGELKKAGFEIPDAEQVGDSTVYVYRLVSEPPAEGRP